MPTGSDYVRDEMRRLANLVTGTDLWTERRLDDMSADGEADNDARPTLAEYPYAEPIDRAAGSVHRRFQILPTRIERLRGDGGIYSANEQDVHVTSALRIAYQGGGGSRVAGDIRQLHSIAVQDAEAVRQRLENPRTYDSGTGTGVTAGRTVHIAWTGTTFAYLPETARLIAELTFVSWLRVDVEAQA